MNQAIRERFYGCGNDRHVEYVIREGGMTEQEAQLFRLLHANADDNLVESIMAIDRKRRASLEFSVSRKVAAAVLHAIDYCAKNE